MGVLSLIIAVRPVAPSLPSLHLSGRSSHCPRGGNPLRGFLFFSFLPSSVFFCVVRRPLLLNTSLLSSPSRECAINMRIACHFVFFPRRGCHLSVFQRKPIDRTNIRLRQQCLLFTLFKTWTATTTFLCIVLVCHFLDFLKVLFMFHDCSMDVIIAKRFSSSSIFIGKYIRAHMFV